MYRISVERHFDAAHYLRGYQGKCENLHGHRYTVAATVKTRELDETGLAFDFSVLKKHLDEILERFDHTCINDIEPFDRINASSENIASTIYGEMSARLADYKVVLESVEVWESPDSRVAYSPD